MGQPRPVEVEILLQRLEPARDVADALLERADVTRRGGDARRERVLAGRRLRHPRLQLRELRVDRLLVRVVVTGRRRGEHERQGEQ